jgi:acid phosphatase
MAQARDKMSMVITVVLASSLLAVGQTAPAKTPVAVQRPTKLLTIIEENRSMAQVQAEMPYLVSLAQRFAYTTNYFAIRHPSLPNYLAIAGGSTFGVADDDSPARHPVPGDSVFDQAINVGKTARLYAEDMQTNCQLNTRGRYAVKHVPWAYFAGSKQRANCQAGTVPAGTPTKGVLASDIAAGTLPNAGMFIPNLCNDAHDCSLKVADDYLRLWLPSILSSQDFKSGRLAVVVTFDEDDSKGPNKIITVVLHPSLDGAHKVVSAPLTHYSLSRWYSEMVGAQPLANAATAADMHSAFGLE